MLRLIGNISKGIYLLCTDPRTLKKKVLRNTDNDNDYNYDSNDTDNNKRHRSEHTALSNKFP